MCHEEQQVGLEAVVRAGRQTGSGLTVRVTDGAEQQQHDGEEGDSAHGA